LISLKSFNTFSIDEIADNLLVINDLGQMRIALKHLRGQEKRVLGGGSNVLLTAPVTGTLLKNELKGIEIIRSFKQSVWVRAAGGESWHDLVIWALQNDLGGIENLSLIPGTVGASPIQNIGAYGVELKDSFISLEAISLESGKKVTFSHDACEFGYRDSVFKREQKGLWLISSVVLKLTKSGFHKQYIAYGDITKQLENIENPTIQDISKAVITIRQSKLPDPAVIGNAGSFFKNPTIAESQYQQLVATYPNMPGYPNDDGVKVPAGWLIEQCGWKGHRLGDAGCHAKQALVLVNYGAAKGAEILQLAKQISQSVLDKYGIELNPEVNVW
jgi:UDP-N-acetylmuramate dehydrogenase